MPDLDKQKKQLSLFDLVCLGVNAIVGMGIYIVPGHLTGWLGVNSPLAYAACGTMSLLIGLCFAETAGMFDKSGGPYVYAKEAFGNAIGFEIGWTCWAAAVLSWAAVATGLPEYAGHIWAPLGHGVGGALVSVSVTILLGFINYFGVKPGAYTTDILTVAKLLPLIILIVTGFMAFDSEIFSKLPAKGLTDLPHATFFAFFAFTGFEVVPVPAGDSKNPRRNAPLALIGSVLGTTALYVAIQTAAMGCTPDLAGAKEPLARMGTQLLGNFGGQIVAAAAMVSMLGFLAGVALAGPRYLSPLANDGFLPSKIAQTHKRFETPHIAIILTTGISAVLELLLDCEQLVKLTVSVVAIQYLSTCAGLLVLRKRKDVSRSKFSLPFGRTIPVAALAVVLVFVGWPLVQTSGTKQIIMMSVLLGMGAALALSWKFLKQDGKKKEGK